MKIIPAIKVRKNSSVKNNSKCIPQKLSVIQQLEDLKLKASIYNLFMDKLTTLYNTSLIGRTQISYSTEHIFLNVISNAGDGI